MCLISIRDYAQMERQDSKKMVPRTIHPIEGGQLVMFDVWNLAEDQYDMSTYDIEDKGESEAVTHILRGGRYYCVDISTLENL